MFNLSYFKYLLKSKKHLLIFLFLISLLISLTNTGRNYIIAYAGLFVMCTAMCYGLPCLIFSYVHNKKAVDSYYSLDIDRKSMLITGLLFCFLSVFIVFSINSIIIYISEVRHFTPSANRINPIIGLPLRLLLMNLGFLTLIVVNTFIYLIGNTVFDGIVMIGSYTILPYAIGLLLLTFLHSFIFGYNETSLKFIGYLSPIFTVFNLFVRLFTHEIVFSNNIPVTVFVLLLYLIIFYLLLYNDYKKRKVERAGTISNNVLAYPFIINVYAFICVFIITCDSLFGLDMFTSISEAIIFYVIIFTLFVIAYFIFSRKLTIDFKIPILFGVYILLSLGICFIANKTEGFGLSKIYTRNDSSVAYDYSIEFNNSEILKGNEFDTWIINNLPEPKTEDNENDYDPNERYLYIYMTSQNSKENLSQETINIFEKIRENSIKEHYNPQESEAINDNGRTLSHLVVYNDVTKYKTGKVYSFEPGHSYSYNNYGYQPLSLEELLKLSYDKNIIINIYYGNGELNNYYSMDLKDGKLTQAR